MESKLRRLVVAFIASFAVLALIIFGYRFRWTGFSGKTLWDWLQLLAALAIPVVVGLGVTWFTTQFNEQQNRTEREIATDNQRETLLHAYIDKLSELLVEKQLHESAPEDGIREIARIRTLTVLSRLNGQRKRIVLQFLHEAGLIDKDKQIIDLHGADLHDADLSEAILSEANLTGADLTKAILSEANLTGADLTKAILTKADLSEADLGGATLSKADLTKAILTEADLSEADLDGADLGGADLGGADLHDADLRDARLIRATLSGANLFRANLRGADLYYADLRFANLSEVTLSEVNLRGAYLRGADLRGATLDGVDLGEARVTTGIKEPAKDKSSLNLPNPDEKYARFHRPGSVRGPLRTFGGPLRLHCNVRYVTGENTVKYIQRSKYALVVKLIVPILILLGLIISMFYFTSLEAYIAIAIPTMLFFITYIIINYVDDVYILTTKRLIDINRRFIFWDGEHLFIEYGVIKDIKVKVGNPLELALDIGTVIVESPGNNPDIEMRLVDKPFFLQDDIFSITYDIKKKKERKR